MQVKIVHKGQSMKVLGFYRMKNGFIIDGPRTSEFSSKTTQQEKVQLLLWQRFLLNSLFVFVTSCCQYVTHIL